VEEIWRDEFDALGERQDAAFVLTMHPQIIGRPGRLAMLDRLVAYIRHSGDAELLRCDELANQTRS
ncbi:MAG: polysaccharide deacetylase, partial [Chloroflexi bacterium]|nr:polysaccharide deacetylase [Chloroflexota bacterium]